MEMQLCILLKDNVCIVTENSLKFVTEGQIHNKLALLQAIITMTSWWAR